MSEKLDNDLKNRIREVFDNYEDETADAGWELLRQRFPEEKKRRVIAWWWYPAAAVLLLCLGTWFFYPQNVTQQMVNQHKKTADTSVITNKVTEPVNTGGETVAINKTGAAQLATAQAANPLNRQQAAKTAARVAATATAPDQTTAGAASAQSKINTPTIAALNPRVKHIVSKKQPVVENESTIVHIPGIVAAEPADAFVKTDRIAQSSTKVKQPVTADQNMAGTDSILAGTTNNVAMAKQPANAGQSVVVQKTADPVLKMIAADDARREALAKKSLATKKTEKAQSDKSVIMSLYAATYFNYAKGSQSQLGVGGGFSSDFRISGNFKISTGLSIGQNRLSYSSDNNIPTQINNQALAMANKAYAYAAPLSSSSSLASVLKTDGPAVKNYNASLVGLDIPLNIKYQFNPKKNDTYISAGISSGTYINETYRSTYAYGNGINNAAAYSTVGLNAINNATPQTQENSSSQHFNSFDFARTLNFSFGMGYPLGKNRLVIEPFLKYPLSGLGAQDIKFGASGVNLKLSFSTSKK